MPSLITTAKLKRLVYFLILIRVKFVKDLRAVHTWCVGTSIWVLPQNGIVPSQLEYPIRDHEHPAGFLKTLSQNGSFKSATIAFFLFSSFPSPRSFFFSFPFSSLLWFWSFLGLTNLPCDAFSLKWLQISLGWFSKNRLDIQVVTPFRTVRRLFETST